MRVYSLTVHDDDAICARNGIVLCRAPAGCNQMANELLVSAETPFKDKGGRNDDERWHTFVTPLDFYCSNILRTRCHLFYTNARQSKKIIEKTTKTQRKSKGTKRVFLAAPEKTKHCFITVRNIEGAGSKSFIGLATKECIVKRRSEFLNWKKTVVLA